MKKFIKLIPVFLLFCLTSITVKAQDSTSLCLEELNTDVYEEILTTYYEVETGYAYCSSAVNLTSSVEITEDVSVTIPDAYGSNVWRVDTSLETADSNCTVVELNNNFYYLSAVSNAVFTDEGVTFSTNKLGIYIAGGCFSEEDIENFSAGTSNFNIENNAIWTDESGKSYYAADAVITWDISKNEDGTVMAYLFDTDADTVGDTVVLDGVGETVGFNAFVYSETQIRGNGSIFTINHRGFGYKGTSYTYYAAPWTLLAYKDNIKHFYITNTSNISFGNAGYLFYYLSNLESVDFNNASFSNVTDMSEMFRGCSSLTTLDLSNFDTTNVINMYGMFYGCSALTSLNLSNFNTSKVTYMSFMFDGCEALTTLNLSNFNTSNVNTISGMFRSCSSLIDLDLSNFNTSKVTQMSEMFSGCKALTSLDLSNFDTSNVKQMSEMFRGCSSLTTLGLSNFNTSGVNYMGSMFRGCSSLTTLDLSNFSTSKVISMADMFNGCSSLTTLYLSNFETSNVTRMNYMFYNCKLLTTLDLSSFDTSKVTDMKSIFSNCSSLTTLDLSNFNTSNVTDMSYMFQYCNALTSLDLSNFNTSKVTNTTNMFTNCKALEILKTPSTNSIANIALPKTMYTHPDNTSYTKLPVTTGTSLELHNITRDGEWLGAYYSLLDKDGDGVKETCYVFGTITDTTKIYGPNYSSPKPNYQTYGFYKVLNDHPDVTKAIINCSLGERTNIGSLFAGCTQLVSLEFGANFDTSNVTDMEYMFSRCSSLTSLYISNFNTSNVITMNGMFGDCNSLTSLNISNFNTSNVITMYNMFDGCKSLVTLDVSNFNTSNVTSMQRMFFYCNSLTTLDVRNFNTSKVTNMRSMFSGCSAFTSLDLSNFDTSKVTNMSSMFYGCKALTTLDLSNFNTVNVTNMYDMFSNCSSLTTLDVSNFNTSNVTSMDSMFRYCSSLTSLNLNNFNTSKVTDMRYMFNGCELLTSLDVSNFDTSKVTNMSSMFENCNALTSLGLSNFNTSNVTDMGFMFRDCSSLATLNLSNFDTSKVARMDYMFYNCRDLTSLDLSNFNTSKVTNMKCVFDGCQALTSLDISNFNTINVTDMSYMFSNCKSLTTLDLSNLDTSNVTTMSNMFYNCCSLTILDVDTFDTSKATDIISMFRNCNSVTILDLSNFDTSKITNMGYMFEGCSSLTSLDLSGFNMSAVTKYANMFTSCTALDKVVLPINVGTCSVNLPKTFYGYAADDTRPYKPQSYTVLPAADASTSLHYISGTKYVAIDALLKDAANADYFLGVEHTSFKRKNIASVNFITNSTLTSSDTVEDAVHGILDVSLIDDEGVFAYSKASSNEGLYDIYVVTKYDKIYTNTNADGGAKYLFKGLYNCDSITGIEYLDLSRSSTAEGMFSGYALPSIEVSSVQYAHSENVDDAGNSTSSAYSNNLKEVTNVSFPGAAKLEITITLQTESTSWDWVAVYPGDVTPTDTNYSEATISNGKLGGSTKTTHTFTYEGDSINILFRTDGSGNKYYGYYAVVKGLDADNNVLSTTVDLPKKEIDLSNLNLPSGINTTDFLTDCGNLTELKTPSTNTIGTIALPITMYTWSDKTSYTTMPTTSGTSVVLHDSDVVPFILNTAGDLYGTIDPVTKVLTITGTGTALDIKLSEALGSEWSSITGIVFDTQTIQEIGNNWCDLTVALTNSKLSGDLVLPTSLVTIGNDAFGFCTFDGTLTIPDSVTTIGDNAFIFCDFTGSLNLPENLQSIGNGAFAYCRRFTGELMLPNSVTTVGSNAFYSCKGFTGTLTISSGMSTIADSTFYKCSGFTKLVISDSVTEIKQKAFFGCNAIADITIGTGLTTIGNEAFACVVADNSSESGYSLVETPISTFLQTTNEVALAYDWASDGRDASVRYILNISGDLYGDLNITSGLLTVKGTGTNLNKALYNVLQSDVERALLRGISFESQTVEIIGWHWCNNHKSSTDGGIVYYFPNLTGNLVLPNSLKKIDDKAFLWCDKLTGDLIIPEGVTYVGQYAFCACENMIGSLVLPSTLTTIDRSGFDSVGCTGSLTLPDSLKNVGASAFSGCHGFTGDLVIPNSVTSIGVSAFENCKGMTGTLTLSNQLTNIPSNCFEYDKFTGDLTIPESVTSIDSYAFAWCFGFNGNLQLSSNLETIGSYAFYCDKFTGDLIIPDKVTVIEEFTFGSGNYTSLTLNQGLQTIKENAFYSTDTFRGDLVIPNSVTTIEKCAFQMCYFNGSLKLPNNITTITAQCFENCLFTGRLVIPDSVSVIENNAFYQCHFDTLVIPNSVTSLGNKAFYNCVYLNKLYIDGGIRTIGEKCFYSTGRAKTYTKLYTTSEVVKNYDWSGDNRTILPMNTFTFALPQNISLKPKYLNVADAPVFYSAFNMEITGDFEDGSYGTFEGVPSFTISTESGETRTVTTNVADTTVSEDGTITVPIIFTAPNPTLTEEFSGQFKLPTVLHEVLPFAS